MKEKFTEFGNQDVVCPNCNHVVFCMAKGCKVPDPSPNGKCRNCQFNFNPVSEVEQ